MQTPTPPPPQDAGWMIDRSSIGERGHLSWNSYNGSSASVTNMPCAGTAHRDGRGEGRLAARMRRDVVDFSRIKRSKQLRDRYTAGRPIAACFVPHYRTDRDEGR